MKKGIKAIVWLLMFLILLGVLSGCKKKSEEKIDEPTEKVEETITEEPEESKEPEIPENQNLLTGLPDLTEEAIGKRPVAVMINNVSKSLPQMGIAQADVIFEIVVEGDQTRFMALYADYTQVPRVCSVRSCRKYFPLYSEGFDAVYVNWGMNPNTREYVNALGLTHYDGIYNTGDLFGRDQDRRNAGYSLEHTGYFDGTRLAETMASRGERTELAENKKGTAFKFNALNEQIKPVGSDCTYVHIDFGAMTGTFNYNEETKTYYKQLNGKDQVDGVTGTQINFTNVFVLETDIGMDPYTDNRWFDWDGDANSIGYYISNGAMQKIHWSKENGDPKGYLKFYDENGEEISINRGKTYIAINHIGQATFE